MELMSDMKKCKKFGQIIWIPKFFISLLFFDNFLFQAKINQIFDDGGSQQAGVNISINAFNNRGCLLMLRINIG